MNAVMMLLPFMTNAMAMPMIMMMMLLSFMTNVMTMPMIMVVIPFFKYLLPSCVSFFPSRVI